jgi:hypothetical protein
LFFFIFGVNLMLRIVILLILPLLSLPVAALSITTTNWDYPASSFPALSQAGNYYNSSFESIASAAFISVGAAPTAPATNNTNCGATNPAWKVTARLSTAVTGLQIRVKRVTNGSGGSLVSGENYITLNSVAQTFFCGSGDIASIGLQFQINHLGVEDSYGTNTWQILYSVETL